MMGVQPSLLTVILHYGDVALTRRVHRALQEGAGEHELLVLDNAAPVPYAGAVRLEENLFWGGALAHALELARQRHAEYLWFCNNDMTFMTSPPLIPKVAGRLARMRGVLGKTVGVWAPAATSSPYHPQMLFHPGVQYRTVTCVDGIAPALALDCVDAIGGLDMGDNARGYGLDLWLSLRAYAAGWPVVVDQQIVVRHRYHTTARRVEGFMAQAARDEDAYMSARLGEDWRKQVRERQARWSDVTTL